jgi:hypothetical protein
MHPGDPLAEVQVALQTSDPPRSLPCLLPWSMPSRSTPHSSMHSVASWRWGSHICSVSCSPPRRGPLCLGKGAGVPVSVPHPRSWHGGGGAAMCICHYLQDFLSSPSLPSPTSSPNHTLAVPPPPASTPPWPPWVLYTASPALKPPSRSMGPWQGGLMGGVGVVTCIYACICRGLWAVPMGPLDARGQTRKKESPFRQGASRVYKAVAGRRVILRSYDGWKYPFSFDHGSQASFGAVSTVVGDQTGTLLDVRFTFCHFQPCSDRAGVFWNTNLYFWTSQAPGGMVAWHRA